MLAKTFGNVRYRTLASGGYIIKIKPIAMGQLVEPVDMALIESATTGNK